MAPVVVVTVVTADKLSATMDSDDDDFGDLGAVFAACDQAENALITKVTSSMTGISLCDLRPLYSILPTSHFVL